MFIIISLIACILELKKVLKNKQLPILFFYLTIVIISIILYYNKDNMPSLYEIIKGIKGSINGYN